MAAHHAMPRGRTTGGYGCRGHTPRARAYAPTSPFAAHTTLPPAPCPCAGVRRASPRSPFAGTSEMHVAVVPSAGCAVSPRESLPGLHCPPPEECERERQAIVHGGMMAVHVVE